MLCYFGDVCTRLMRPSEEPRMIKKNLPIIILIIAVLVIIFVGKPHVRRRNALNVVRSVLAYWQKGDLPSAMAYWEKEQDSPPVSSLLNYEITEKEFSRERNIYIARISAVLNFPEGSQFPSKREWIFELNKTRRGWKIVGFHLKK